MTVRKFALIMALALSHLPAEAAPPVERLGEAQRPGARWEVISVGAESAPTGAKSPAATLFLDADGSIGGTWECNSGGSAYVRWTNDGEFTGTKGPIIFTAMGCGEKDKADFAGKFWRLMGEAKRWERSGKMLIIHAADGSVAHLRLTSEVR